MRLCRYPRPLKVVFDNGSEFKQEFTTLIKYFGIKAIINNQKPISERSSGAGTSINIKHA